MFSHLTPTSPIASPLDLTALDAMSDVTLGGLVADIISHPRHDPADSFVLHAPLELAARMALLPHVRPDARPLARRRLVSLADGYSERAPSAHANIVDSGDVVAAAGLLTRAIEAGDLDAVDMAATTLGRHCSGTQLRHLLAEQIAPRLSAAAHGSIFLYQLPRVSPRGELTTGLLRPLIREVARYPDWLIGWIDEQEPIATSTSTRNDDGGLFDAISSAPQLGIPGSTFIFPIVAQVDHAEIAGALVRQPVTTADFRAGARSIMRAAAWTMLLEPVDHAPYGWSHALTLPQSVLGIAGDIGDPARALAIAATQLIGFRAALSTRPLLPRFEQPDPGVDLASELALGRECEPDRAASAAWHTPASMRRTLIDTLVANAATAHDAHLVKYTLASLDAAADDPGSASLHLAAAAKLAAVWAQRGDPDDPLS